jgi:lysophospholipase L1-like esterase
MTRLGLDQPTDVPAVRLRNAGEQDPEWMTRHHGFVAQARQGEVDLYLTGDSLIDLWGQNFAGHFEKTFGRWRTCNFAISGDRTEHLLWRLQNGELEGVNPRAVMVCIGTNNLPAIQGMLYAGKTVEEVASGVKAVLGEFGRRVPGAKVLLVGLLPREDRLTAMPPMGPEDLMGKVRELNGMLAGMEGGRVKYLSFFEEYLGEDGKVKPGLLFDRLHPDVGGYDVWAKAVVPVLREWLG